MEEHEVRAIACLLSDGSASEKAVPEPIFRLPGPQLATFLRVLFSCAGSLYVNRRGQAGLSYSTISNQLAKDVQHLLLRFGIISKLRTQVSRVRARSYVAHEIEVLSFPVIQRFLNVIGIIGRDRAKEEISRMGRSDTVPLEAALWGNVKNVARAAGTTIRNRRHDRPLTRTTLVKLASAFPDPYLERLATSDIYWDAIETVTPAGEAEVYDLSVPDGANLVANDLVVHNSTLVLQASRNLASAAAPPVLYVSGEESAAQIKLRGQRLGVMTPQLLLLAETNLEAIIDAAGRVHPRVLVIDSIQTVFKPDLSSAPGSVGQVRGCAADLLRLAKGSGTAVLLVGHVTKEGQIAGPRVLEHIVDTVLYFEGDRQHVYRILRATKNRFGSTNEIGVFEMRAEGLREVTNPSAAFLSERAREAPGASVVCAQEGSRPLLVEIQALVTPTVFGMPRRTASGLDYNRVVVLLAVLEKRAGLHLSSQDVYVSVAGGLTVDEPAVDLGIAAAVASSLRNRSVDETAVAIGEVGLAGEIRAVPHLGTRIAEAARMGFRRVIVPRAGAEEQDRDGVEAVPVEDLAEALAVLIP